MAKPPFGVLLAGGWMTHQENYGPGFAADPRARVIGVTDEPGTPPDRIGQGRKLAAEMGVPYLEDYAAALGRRDVHLVSVCSAFERRAQAAEQAARAGKHVYLDKPLAATLGAADRLVEAVRAAGVRNQMFTQVGQGYAQRAKRIVEAGTLGEIRAIHCDLLFAKGYPGTAPLGRPRQEHYPPPRFTFPLAKREIWTTAVYSLTLIRWLTGRAFRSVFATSANYFFREHLEEDVEDFGALAVTLEGGVTATLTAGRIGWQSHHGSGPNFTRLVGTRGSLTIDGHAPRFEIASDRPPWRVPERDPLDPMGFWKSTQDRARVAPKPQWSVPQVIAARSDQGMFLDCLEQERAAEVTVADGALAVEAVLAAYLSAAEGRVVALPLPR